MSQSKGMSPVITLTISDIALMERFQIRNKISQDAVSRYRQDYKNNVKMPPVQVGRLNGQLFLIDGFHRIEALSTIDRTEVEAEIIDFKKECDMLWHAAQANMKHGVPLGKKEIRNVFKAYVSAGKHWEKRPVKYKSWRGIASELGAMAHTTIQAWMKKDFPKIWSNMSEKNGEGLTTKGAPDWKRNSFSLCKEAIEHITVTHQAFSGISRKEDRATIILTMERHLHEMRQEFEPSLAEGETIESLVRMEEESGDF